MRIVIIDTYYPRFLENFYNKNSELKKESYEKQLNALLLTCFGTSDFYSMHLRSLGYDAIDIIANCSNLQRRWAIENGFRFNTFAIRLSPKWQRLPFMGRFLSSSKGLLSICVEQIKRLKPDILYVQDLSLFPSFVLKVLKSSVKLVVGQIACPLPPNDYLSPYDLILTSFPHYVKHFRQQGINSEYFRIGFEPSVLERIGTQEKRFDCTFIGGISYAHSKGTALLEYLAENINIDFFGYGADSLPASSPIKAKHHGEVWGLEMYKRLAQSRFTLNRHIDVAENYANNMRLYEATGCGALLITDMKDNLGELFEIDKEIIAYSSKEEAEEKIRYYLEHQEEAEAIAVAGQKRTIAEHNYANRMKELDEILKKYL